MVYKKVNSEKIEYIKESLECITNILNYKIISFTIDDRKGVIQLLKRLYPNTPIQLCQFPTANFGQITSLFCSLVI